MNEKDGAVDNQQQVDAKPGIAANFAVKVEALAVATLHSLLEAMFDDADDTLFGMAEKAHNNRSQALHFDTMRALRMDRPQILERFKHAIVDSLNGRGHKSDPGLRDTAQLELQDMASLEKSIAISNMTGRGYQLCGRQYGELKSRLGWLRQQGKADIPAEAISPRGVCLSFEHSMDPVEIDLETRLLVYKLFDLIVVVRLSELYQAINRYLDDQGVPVDGPGIVKSKQAQRGHAQPTPTEPDVATQPGGASAHGHAQGSFAGPGGGHSPATTYQGAGITPGVLGAGGAPSSAPAATDSGLRMPLRGARYGRLLGVLDSLQDRVLTSGDADLLNRDWLGQQLRAAITAPPADGSDDTVPQDQMRLFDLLNTLFNDLLTDPGISNPVKVLLARLEIPVIKIAMIDPEFLRRHLHPARELLSEVALLGARVVDEQSPLFPKLKSLVETLLRDFNQDLRVIERTVLSLRELAITDSKYGLNEDQARRRARNVHTTNVAKQAVLRELRYQTREKQLPAPLKEFVLRVWAPFMGLQYAKHGPDSTVWRSNVSLLGQIVDSFQPNAFQYSSALRENSTMVLMQALRSALGGCGLDPEMIDRRLLELETYYRRGAQQLDVTDGPAEPAPATPQQQLRELLSPTLRLNNWFQLYTGPEYKFGRWLKVHSYKPDKDQVGFSNHRGQMVVSKTLFELAEEICDGRSRPIFSDEQKFHTLQADLTFAMRAPMQPPAAKDLNQAPLLESRA